MNVVRAVSSEGWGRIKYHTTMRGLLDTDRRCATYFEGETDVLPPFYRDGCGGSSGRSGTTCRKARWSTIPTRTSRRRPAWCRSRRVPVVGRWRIAQEWRRSRRTGGSG